MTCIEFSAYFIVPFAEGQFKVHTLIRIERGIDILQEFNKD